MLGYNVIILVKLRNKKRVLDKIFDLKGLIKRFVIGFLIFMCGVLLIRSVLRFKLLGKI